MKIIALTGSFGTGKTSVAAEFRSLGAKVIDADRIAHHAMRKGTGVYRKIVRVFGTGVVSGSGSVDRKALGCIVFNDTRKLTVLERIVHPEVIRVMTARLAKAGAHDTVVIDAPLLLEAGLTGIADSLVVVTASKKRQIDRCVKKFSMSREDAQKRIDRQIPLQEKIRMADFVIDNDGPRSLTRKQVRKVWCSLWK